MRYFFHIAGGEMTIQDDKGADYADLASARHSAIVLACELVRQQDWRCFTIIVATPFEPEVMKILVASRPTLH